jgi:hypothetical protein
MRADARNSVRLSEWFTLDEFESPDTGQVILDGHLFLALDLARVGTGVPIVISSGYRTANHNAAVGGKPASLHLVGRAADLVFGDPLNRARVVEWLLRDPRVVVIDEGDHVHVQVRGVSPRAGVESA